MTGTTTEVNYFVSLNNSGFEGVSITDICGGVVHGSSLYNNFESLASMVL